MQRRFHALAGAAGALACGLAAALWCAFAPPPYVAAATVSVEASAEIPAAYDEAALRVLASSEMALRRAALAPEAAAAISQEARPTMLDRLLSMFSVQPNAADSLSRAADLLARRIEIEKGPTARSARIRVRMQDPEAARAAAEAVAQAVVASHNETAARIDRRLDRARSESLARAERRRDIARARLAALQNTDQTPTATIVRTQAVPDNAAEILAAAQRAFAAAQTRRNEAARIYGPRHPEMIQTETDARRAEAALKAARAKMATSPLATRQPLAEGGPDPRANEIAAAEKEADRAERDYEREAQRFATPDRQARVEQAASAPKGRDRPPSLYIVAASSLLGFILFGGAAGFRPQTNWSPHRAQNMRPHATMRMGALDEAGAANAIAALDIAASDGARRILVDGESARDVRETTLALAVAALAEGWRPLVIENAGRRGAARGVAILEHRAYAVSAVATRDDKLFFARPLVAPRDGFDVDTAFDLVLFAEVATVAQVDVCVWAGRAAPADAGIPLASPIVWIGSGPAAHQA